MDEATRSIDDRFQDPVIVGSGSMGTVYRAWDRATLAPVALKLLHNADAAPRFAREGRVLSQIEHPNIVKYVAHGVSPFGRAWLAMEWLEGCDLDTYLDEGPLPPWDAVRLARAIAQGLAWAHERGFIHRDLKPSNVFVVGRDLDQAKIVDFGLARDVVQDEALTKTGTLIGTLEYMAPEQLTDAKRVDARADVYGLGAVFFRCLTGHPPVTGNNLPHLLMNIVRSEIPYLTELRPDVPPAVADLVASMLQKDPDLRPQTASHVLPALDALCGLTPVADYDPDGATELMRKAPSYYPTPAPPPHDLVVLGDDNTVTERASRPPLPPVAPPLPPVMPPPRSGPFIAPAGGAAAPLASRAAETMQLPRSRAAETMQLPRQRGGPDLARFYSFWPLGLLAVGILALIFALAR